MDIFWSSVFQPLKGRTQIFLQLMFGTGISEGGFLGAEEKGDGALRRGARGRDPERLHRPHPGPLPRWCQSEADPRGTQDLAGAAAESEVTGRMTRAAGADWRKPLSPGRETRSGCPPRT